MDYQAMKIVIDVLQFLITGGIGVYVYLVNRGDAINKRVSRLEKDQAARLDDHERRIGVMEGCINMLPTHNDISGVKVQLSGLTAETRGQTDLLERLTKQVDRINEWLIARAT